MAWVPSWMLTRSGSSRCRVSAQSPAAEADHPVACSVVPGEDWSWCYVDEVMFVVT
ncbi:MAG TPA: hypothetical protein VFI04_08085 [Gaiellaceae bacterium]|nr:hypothetical protein [Gaiellaceae bacterium]